MHNEDINKTINMLWKLQVDMMNEVDRICTKHNIEYFAEGGTLLGAVRHKGFIPWDDDIDLGMTRENYNRFMEACKKELDSKYFLQDNSTEKNFFRVHGQIRLNNSTMLIKYDYKRKYHRGVFIDIFIYDKVPSDIKLETKFRNKLELYRKLLVYKQMVYETGIKRIIKNIIGNVGVLLHGGFNNLVKKFEKLSAKYNNLESNYYYDLVSYNTNKMRLNLPSDIFDNFIKLDFENTSVVCVKNYDTFLRKLYGDNYMTPIQAENDHGDIFVDLDNDYHKYDNLSRNDYEELFNGQKIKN